MTNLKFIPMKLFRELISIVRSCGGVIDWRVQDGEWRGILEGDPQEAVIFCRFIDRNGRIFYLINIEFLENN